MTIQVVILAAGQGTRMCSNTPKILHKLAGKTLIEHVLSSIAGFGQKPIIVYGHGGESLKNSLQDDDLQWVYQEQQRGTAHAVLQTLPLINDEDQVLILYADVPLISKHTLLKLCQQDKESLGFVTAVVSEPLGYGRVKRNDQGEVLAIIEDKDCTTNERQLTEINTGIYFVSARLLKKWLPLIHNNNHQAEYYLTDIIKLARRDHIHIQTIEAASEFEVMGVNDRVQLARLERFYQRQYAEKLQKMGVTLADPHRFDVRGELVAEPDVFIDINVIVEGIVKIGSGSIIGPNVYLKDVEIGKNVEIKANSIIEQTSIHDHAMIGPFARIRPNSIISESAHVGNFVEIKNSMIGKHSKVNHLSYVGDSLVGQRVNVGAGTITCNYDGANKHQTIIGDDVHIGSDTQLVAPVTIGQGATIAAGSTIVKNVTANKLTITHELKQRIVDTWERPTKEKA